LSWKDNRKLSLERTAVFLSIQKLNSALIYLNPR